ncbi:unnamed protein product [Sphagnum jensenii]|uniref:Topo IIA-type catalytic domain-containing protein n=1 Tax=Sphagnum jensenii TaxID=128206 RepID=A0ABP0VL35_9BRYO
MNKQDGVVPSLILVGQTATLHPYGDMSIYKAVARLGQAFEYRPKLLDFPSKVGTYAKPRPGGARYTKEGIADFARDVFFSKTIEYNAIPKELDELLYGYEPIYLPPTIPTALLYANSTIGYGDSSYTIPRNLADVCDITIAFTQHMKTAAFKPFDPTQIAEKFIPDFPIENTITNYDELIAFYRQGQFEHKVRMDGSVVLSSDSIVIRTLPYRARLPFEDVKEKIEDLIRNKDQDGWFDNAFLWIKSLSGGVDYGEIIVKLKRGINVFEAWEMLSPRISFSGTYTPFANYNNDGYAEYISVSNLLSIWYEARYNIIVSSKKIKIKNLTEALRRVEAILIICDNIDDVITLVRQNDDEGGIAALQKAFNLTWFQADFLVGAPLKTLAKTSKGQYELRKKNIESELLEIQASFGNIPDEMAADALAIKKKYALPRKTKIPHYIGYIKIDGGCIQFEMTTEIPELLANFPKGELEIHIYDGPYLYKVDDEGWYFYTTSRSRAIYRNGEIKSIAVIEEISLRKTICRGAATNIIYVYPEQEREHFVISLNTSTPGVIFVQRVGVDRSKIAMNPVGEVLVIHSTDAHTFVNIPQKFLHRSSLRVIEFLDLDKLLTTPQVKIDLATQATKNNKLIRLY